MQTRTSVVPPRSNGLPCPSAMDDALPAAIDQADLPALVGCYYPDSGARPGRKGVVFAVWRGDEHTSFSLFKSDSGRWLYRDHRTCESGNAFGFLTDICGLTRAEAAAVLKAGGVAGGAPNPTPFPARRRRKTQIGAGDAVYEALWRAVADRRIVGFKHPLSQALLSQENALLCVRNALETPTAGDAQRILKAAHSVLKETARSRQKARGEGKPVAFYDYVDEQQKLLYQVVRFRPKRFSQRRPYKDGWAWGTTEGDYVKGHRGNLFLDNDAPEAAERVSLDACKQVLYRLPRALATLKAGSAVHIVEGEEDVHALEALGLTATCNSGGAGKWNDAYAEVFRGGLAYVLPDNDPAGHDHAQRIVESLADVAKHVQLVRLPGLPPKGDVRDWLKTHDRQQLIAQITQSSPGH